MTELKVRFWDIDNAQMSAGLNYEEFAFGNVDLEFPGTEESLPWKDFVFWRKEHSGPMLYSGIKDMKGNEIYVNDLVRNNQGPNVYVFQVVFEQGVFGSRVSRTQIDPLHELFPADYLEVIGNSYANPELLRTTGSSL